MGFSGFMGEIDDEQECAAANRARILAVRDGFELGMQTPVLIRPVQPADDNARKAGCKCNRRSSQPGSKHHPDCMLYRN